MAFLRVFFIGCILISPAFAISLAYPSSYSNPQHEKCNRDQSGSQCIDASQCRSTEMDLAYGRKPVVCGWNGNVPKVCCTMFVVDRMAEYNKWSRISPKGCGVRFPNGTVENNRDFTIAAVGGRNAIYEWPWMVAIFTGPSSRQLCGGVLINDRHVLTAAHCFAARSLNPDDYAVSVAILELTPSNEKLPLEDIKIHEGYSEQYNYNDIAILRLASPTTKGVPACVPAFDNLKQDDMSILLGWGDLSFGGASTVHLQEVLNLPIILYDECDDMYRGVSDDTFPNGITETLICAGLEDGGKDACQGDSGGPLLHEDGDGIHSVIGIVSFGYGCAEAGYPGVYTKVSSFTPWIEEYIEDGK